MLTRNSASTIILHGNINRKINQRQQKKEDTIAIKAIDTTLLLFIDRLRPIIGVIATFIRLVLWKEEGSKSLVLLLSWILWWSAYKFILCALPIIILLSISAIYCCSNNKNVVVPEKEELLDQQYQTLETDLLIICSLIPDLKSFYNIQQKIARSENICYLYHHYYAMATKSRRRHLFLLASATVAFLFATAYTAWIFLLKFFNFNVSALVWLFGLLVIIWNCPRTKVVVHVGLARVVSIVPYLLFNNCNNLQLQKDKKTTFPNNNNARDMKDQQRSYEEPSLTATSTLGYRFQVYHHQRWWFPTGWSNILLPQDRPVWSDTYLEATPSVQNFRLPPTTFTNERNTCNKQKIVTWAWIDPSWSKQQDNHTNVDGWQYGSWKWKSWGAHSSGLNACTRRQVWYRHAERIESWVYIVKDGNIAYSQEEEGNILPFPFDEGESDSTMTSSYWDTSSIDTAATSSCSDLSDNDERGVLIRSKKKGHL